MPTVHESQLPPVLEQSHMCQLLGMSVRTMNKRRKGRSWPFSEIARLDRKPRWSRDQVLAIINGQQLPARRR